jgi:hypothetical protein
MRTTLLINTAIVLLLSGTLCSCKKDLKETTRVDFLFHITKDSIPAGIVFTTANITIDKISVSGTRKQGAAVGFTDNIAGGLALNLFDGSVQPTVYYDMPQGVYQQIAIDVKASPLTNTPSIVLKGRFTHDGKTDPLVFEFNASQVFNIPQATKNNSSEIVLVADNPATCDITFDLNYWFGTLTGDIIEQAKKTKINGVETIVINETTNQTIYTPIVARINQTTVAVFK